MKIAVQADEGRTFSIRPGETIQVVLPENASTGYRWALDAHDPEAIELLDAGADYAGAALGSGGNAVFVFRGKKGGETRVTLKHWRRWEGEASIVARYGLIIRVE